MTQQFPPKPWNVDDTFVNIETGVEYVFKGEQWIAGGSTQYEPGYTALGQWQYKRSSDADAGGVFRNKAATGAQPHNSLTEVRVNNTPKGGSGPVVDPNSWQPGQLLRIEKGNDKVIYEITAATASTNYGDLTLRFIELQGSPFTFYVDDRINLEVRKLLGDPIDNYLPLTGGKLSDPGNLNVEGQLKVSGGNEFKLEYDDATSMFRIQPNANQITSKASVLNLKSVPGDALNSRAGLDIQVQNDNPVAISNTGSYQPTFEIYGYDADEPGGRARNLWIGAQGNINTEGNVNAQSFVKGSELRSTKLTSGQSSNLTIYRGSGADEQRKILVGTDSVNFDVDIKLVGPKKDIVVQNGTKLYVTSGEEIITFGGTGAFYRGTISTDDHLINKGYVDTEITELDEALDDRYVKTAGTSTVNQGAIRIIPRDAALKGLVIWEGDPETGEEVCYIDRNGHLNTTATTFSDQDCVTKKYVDEVVDLASRGRVKLGEFVLRTTSGQPTGNANAGELTLWHTTAGSSTTPPNEFKLRPTADAEYSSLDIYNLIEDLFEDSKVQVVLKQGDQEMHFVGKDKGWLTDSSRTFHLSAESYSGDELFVGNVVELFAEVKVSDSLDDFYLKTGGDIHGFVRVVKDAGVVLGTRPNDLADNLFQVWADGVVEMKNYLQFDGTTREIKSGSTTMFDFSGTNVRIPRKGDNSIGFQLKGKALTNDENLLNVFHRPDYDEVMYRGKIDDPYAIVTKSWVEANAGGINPGDQVARTDGSTSVEVGGFYISGGSLYVKVS